MQGRANEIGFPGLAELSALRAWYEGLSAHAAASQYLSSQMVQGRSARTAIGNVRRQLARHARARQREDLAALFTQPVQGRERNARAIHDAMELLRSLPVPEPLVTDPVAHWLPTRAAHALNAHGIQTLADLTVRVPRARRWWATVPGLGVKSGRAIEAFFAAHPALTERAKALVVVPVGPIVPWEHMEEGFVPQDLDGSQGLLRAPAGTCLLAARNDYEAVQAWLALQDSQATRRAYRKEAERLLLWAILEQKKALSSLVMEDAIQYRAFLRRPAPRGRWVGPARPRACGEWRPFQDNLAPMSVAYALSVVSALFRWLVEQRYLLGNPFAGVKVKGARHEKAFDASRMFTDHEWTLVRGTADGIEWTDGWTPESAQRLRFVLEFWYATGLRPSEMVAARLGAIECDAQDAHWLNVTGKGSKCGKVALPFMARSALEHYLVQRGLPLSRELWNPKVPLVPALAEDGAGISGSRLWSLMRRFFLRAAASLEKVSPSTAEKLKRATPHWMRHTHASHALAHGVALTTVRDNLRHASVATTSVYLHADEIQRARQIGEAFPVSFAGGKPQN
ncbi:site-specific integrase [Variovorax sp. J22R133]|uniref:site-specific integrase n=1 Tax=Variovorax brevis TaxID=3053503 RepID=UPI0025759DFA|nr:site-specific integrase [Variovorax sp. J22R133]MDM0116217.1 site-specific integrase [Variovorax sp. J22R133]